MSRKPTAIIYARVSTVRQADDGLPIDSQIEQAKAKAEQLEATVLRVFRDDGISGRTSRRPAFQDAIAYCSAMDVDFFIVWNTSRFARNKIDAASYKALLRQGGTKVVYVTSDIDSETDEGWFSESIFEIVDEHYSRVIARDTRRSMMKNARDGYFNGGHIPFGYAVVPDGKRKKLNPAEPEAQLVRDMFSAYSRGAGTKEIAMQFNAAGRLKRGTRWNKNTVTLILKNPVYAGFIVFNRRDHRAQQTRPMDDWITTRSHEPIVTEEDFMRVQDIMSRRAPRENGGSPHSGFVFTGILRCGKCGSAMQTESATGRNATYRYYNCRSALKGQGCENRRIPAQEFDDWMVASLLDKVLTRERILDMVREVQELSGEWYRERAVRRDAIVTELRQTEAKRSKLFEVLELHGKDAPNLGDLTTRLRSHKDRIEGLEAQLAKLEEEEAPLIDIGENEIARVAEDIREIISTTEDAVKLRTFFSGFVDRIVLEGGVVRVEYNPEKILKLKPRLMGAVHSEIRWLPEHCLLGTGGIIHRTASIAIELPQRWRRAA